MASQSHAQLLEAFRLADAAGCGRIASEDMVEVLRRLGLPEEAARQLVASSGCSAPLDDSTEEVKYEDFIQWLVGTTTPDIMDAGLDREEDPFKLSSSSPTSVYGGWVERCARVLEQRGEADFIQKKIVTAQVEAHIHSLEEEEKMQEGGAKPSSQPRVTPKSNASGELLNASSALEWDGPALMERLLREGPEGIPASYVEQVLDMVLTELPARYPRSLVRLRVPNPGRLVVVGDTHGQLQDVLLIFLLHGVPTRTNTYLFNGDVADRGPNSCAIFLLIFAFFLTDPATILLTRGNHEDEHMNMMSADHGGGFFDECLRKYGETVYWKFVEVFKVLPLATTINDEVFVVHGGLPGENLPSLKQIEAIDHTKVCCPDPDAEGAEERLFIDLMWSDPMETPGHEPNPRGTGSLWGPDATKTFLTKNNLRWIIRSHELPWDGERGWMEHHLGLVFTLFSASNYWGHEVNWGAVALLTVGADGRVEQALREFNISSLDILPQVAEAPEGEKREERCREIGLSWVDSDRVAVGERRVQLALRRMAGIVIENKPELWQEFRKCDKENTSSLGRDQWMDALVTICGEDLPWEEAAKFWIPEPIKVIDYSRFLDRFKVVLSQEKWCGWKSLVIADVYEELLCSNAAAQDLLRRFDPSGDGIVSVDDFREFMSECTGGRLTDPQIDALSRTVFANAKGHGLRMSKFLSRFTLAFVQSKGMTPTAANNPVANIGPTMDQIGKLILGARADAQAVSSSAWNERRLSQPATFPPGERVAAQFQESLMLDRSVSAVGALGLHSSTALRPSMEMALPPPPLGLDRAVTTGGVLAPAPVQLAREQSSALVKTFEKFNDSGDGLLQVDEFVKHVIALPGFENIHHNGKPLDEETLREIASTIALESCGDSTINLLQFARAFAVVDASGSTDLADDLHEHILTFLYRHKHAVRTSCAKHDIEGVGRVRKQDFARVLESINFITARPKRQLTRSQMSVLVESIAEDDGCVDYEAFLASFEIHSG